MMYTLKLLVLFAFLSIITLSCNKEDEKAGIKGCRDINSVNYNANATVSDGNCRYVADQYAGNYIANDTSTFTDQNGLLVTNISQYSFSITKASTNQVMLLNFFTCDSAHANVTTTNLTLTNPADECYFGNFISRFNGQKLSYSYQYSPFYVESIRGTAIKQQ